MRTQTPAPTLGTYVTRVSSLIYRLLWWAALIVSYNLHKEHQLGLSGHLPALLGITATLLLGLIYLDMDKVEALQSGDRDYSGWVGVGKKIEVILRFLIVLCLLFAVGELHVLENIGLWVFTLIHRILGLSDDSSLTRIVSSLTRSDAFVVGSCGTYGFLVLWNLGALRNHCRAFAATAATLKSDARGFVHYLVLIPRIGVFVVLAGICFLYWVFVWRASGEVEPFAQLFLIVFCACVGFVFLLRIDLTRNWIESKLTKIVEWFRSESTQNA